MDATNPQLIEAAALFLQGASGSIHVTSLNKGLFYADLAALLDTGSTITGTMYVALPKGPVVEGYKQRLVAALEAAGLAEQDDSDALAKPLYLIAAPVRSVVSEQHAALLEKAAKWAKSKTPTQLVDYSHRNHGWIAAFRAGLDAGLPARVINLRIAMQQIVDEDPWMNGRDPELVRRLTAAEAESGAPW